MKKIAFIGTGVMGAPMALHLADAGFNVTVYNRTYSKAKILEPKVKAFETIEETIKDADYIITIVGYPSDVKEVYDKVIPIAKKKAILIDMTTSSPKLAVELYALAKKNDLYMLDAPVTGGDTGAKNATLSIMVGGDENVFKIALEVFNCLGKTITYMGETGNGQNMKLANQAAIASGLSGIAETLSFAKLKNLDLEKVLQVITGGSANSWQASSNGRKMIDNNMNPGFYVKHFLKDLRLILDEMGDLDLVVTKQVAKIYEYLSKHGCEDLGTQTIIKYYLKQV